MTSTKYHWFGHGCFQYLATFTATLTMVSSGMHYSWPTPSIPKMLQNDSYIQITSEQGSWLAVIPLLSGLLGSAIACLIVDNIGRKWAVQISNIPFFVSWILIGFSENILGLYVARSICGLADGWIFAVIPMYIGEIADPKLRGLLGSVITVTWLLGILLINIIGSYLSIPTTAFVASCLPIITVAAFSCMPESPYYLLLKNKLDLARKNLQVLTGVKDVDVELERINNAVQSQMTNEGKFCDLFKGRHNIKGLYIVIILRGTQQLCGTSAITFYSEYIFYESGSNVSSATSTIIYFCVQLVVATFSSAIVDKAGRKPLLIISSIGSAFTLVALSIYFYIKCDTSINTDKFSAIPLLCLISFVILFSIGLQTIPVLVIGEIFPVNTKAFALFVADLIDGVFATAASKFFQIADDSFGMYVPFAAFAVCSLVGTVAIIISVPETKGQTLEEIQKILRDDVGSSQRRKSIQISKSFIV